MRSVAVLCCLLAALGWARSRDKKDAQAAPTPLDLYIEQATSRAAPNGGGNSGSIWSPSAPLTDLGRDLRARFVDDIVTVLVTERASAVTRGNVQSARQSSAKSSVAALGGITRAKGPFANLANLSTDTSLKGEASTSRETVLNTSLSARVTQVLPNGNLVIEGSKEVIVNTDRQLVSIRGVVRPTDLTGNNVVPSDRVAQMEVRINGKGVVGDAVRRPFFLYRLLLGLLPF